ncbi:MAG: HAD family hydrolase [Nitrososphaerales archaeon]
MREEKKPIFIFDIGGVVIIWRNNDPIFKYIAKRYGIPFTKLRDFMISNLGDLESGKINCNEFVKRSLEHFGKKLRRKDDPGHLITLPFAQKAKTRKGVVEIISGLRNQGYKVYGFSNTNYEHELLMKQRGWSIGLFDRFFSSCAIKAVKPDVKAYRRVLKALQVNGKNVVFIDNTVENVQGARRAGIKNTIRFHSISKLRQEIAKILSSED